MNYPIARLFSWCFLLTFIFSAQLLYAQTSPATSKCDAFIRGNVTVAQAQAVIDAATDMTGDGRTTICFQRAVIQTALQSELGPHGIVIFERSNLDLVGIDSNGVYPSSYFYVRGGQGIYISKSTGITVSNLGFSMIEPFTSGISAHASGTTRRFTIDKITNCLFVLGHHSTRGIFASAKSGPTSISGPFVIDGRKTSIVGADKISTIDQISESKFYVYPSMRSSGNIGTQMAIDLQGSLLMVDSVSKLTFKHDQESYNIGFWLENAEVSSMSDIQFGGNGTGVLAQASRIDSMKNILGVGLTNCLSFYGGRGGVFQDIRCELTRNESKALLIYMTHISAIRNLFINGGGSANVSGVVLEYQSKIDTFGGFSFAAAGVNPRPVAVDNSRIESLSNFSIKYRRHSDYGAISAVGIPDLNSDTATPRIERLASGVITVPAGDLHYPGNDIVHRIKGVVLE